jgi:hypothetical protein
MGKTFDDISAALQEFIRSQHMFFVATAPLSDTGRVNLSPKGMDTFRILDANRVAYLDLTGSGNETSAHLAENGRVTFMFCAFEGAANIVRLYGTGRTVLPDSAEWDALIGLFPTLNGTRQIILADIDRVSTACGYAVPFMDFKSERETLVKHWNVQGADALPEYWRTRNIRSIDGLITPISGYVESGD